MNYYGRARVDPSNPRAFGVCQRCGIWYNREDLLFQYQWGGQSLINLQILVCEICLDVPQDQLRSIIIPPDPLPVWRPSVEAFSVDEQGGTLYWQDGELMKWQDGSAMSWD